jgi:hypothetical protein
VSDNAFSKNCFRHADCSVCNKCEECGITFNIYFALSRPLKRLLKSSDPLSAQVYQKYLSM